MHSFNGTTCLPEVFPSPFNNQPHALAKEAADDLQRKLPRLTNDLHDFHADNGGKMLGVLVVADSKGALCYLAGFSGMLGGRLSVDGFVPPVYDEVLYQQLLTIGQQHLDAIEREIAELSRSEEYTSAVTVKNDTAREVKAVLAAQADQHRMSREKRHALRRQHPLDRALLFELAQQSKAEKKQRRDLQRQTNLRTVTAEQNLQPYVESLEQLAHKRRTYSAMLQKKLFDHYRIPSVGADEVALRSLFYDNRPPGGAGDCAAVKLLNAAIRRKLKPVCLAEFWWGADSGLRRHGFFYPACRSKCRPILPHMLRGLNVTTPAHEAAAYFPAEQPQTVFEDDHIVVVAKPAGMLSVPGQSIVDSVETRLRQRYPRTDNRTLLLHRLDQATSGVMIAAKNARTYKRLQHQFQQRTVNKIYMAELASTTLPARGEITLPLRVDLEDRPRQIVCYKHGKHALTHYKVMRVGQSSSTVEFKPVTGRTHQLRVHAAHPDGLNAPIVGDQLYGMPSERLYLHAQSLSFTHPLSGERLSFSVAAPFVACEVAMCRQ